MSDYKIQFIREIEAQLAQILDSDSFEPTINAITRALNGYEITKPTTEITPYISVNESLLKMYCGCLLVGGKSEKTIAQYKRTIEKFADLQTRRFWTWGYMIFVCFSLWRSKEESQTEPSKIQGRTCLHSSNGYRGRSI